jgi:hypothetical protein
MDRPEATLDHSSRSRYLKSRQTSDTKVGPLRSCGPDTQKVWLVKTISQTQTSSSALLGKLRKHHFHVLRLFSSLPWFRITRDRKRRCPDKLWFFRAVGYRPCKVRADSSGVVKYCACFCCLLVLAVALPFFPTTTVSCLIN